MSQEEESKGEPAQGNESATTGSEVETSSAYSLEPPVSMQPLDDPSTGVDFSEGVAQFQGQRIDPTQNRAFRSQFETYLTKDRETIEALAEYQSKIDEVLGILSPLHMIDGDDELYNQVEKAYKKLYELAEYDVDGSASRTLAHMIFNMWRLRFEIRKDINQIANYNFGKHEIYHVNKAQVESKARSAQLQFETQIVYFIAQRRFDHAMMAGYFYRMLFKGSKQELPQVGDAIKAAQQMFDKFNFGTGSLPMMGDSREFSSSKTSQVYTVEAVEQFSQTIKGKIREHMESLDRTFERGEYQSALERLQEAFIPGEYLGSVMTLPLEKRDLLLRLYRLHRKLDEYSSAKDYEAMLTTLDAIDAMTDDFIPGSSMRSQATSAMRMSKFKLVAAKQALSDGEYERGEKLMQESVKLWPLNPRIDLFADQVSDQGDAAFKYGRRFDEWIQSGDLKRVFENREALGLAFAKDPLKLEELKRIVREYSTAAFLMQQASDMVETAPLLAWDLLAEVPASLTEDVDYLLIKQKLLSAALPYAKLLEQAKAAESQGKWNVAISYYVKAQSLSPMSKIASKGIERANSQLLALSM